MQRSQVAARTSRNNQNIQAAVVLPNSHTDVARGGIGNGWRQGRQQSSLSRADHIQQRGRTGGRQFRAIGDSTRSRSGPSNVATRQSAVARRGRADNPRPADSSTARLPGPVVQSTRGTRRPLVGRSAGLPSPIPSVRTKRRTAARPTSPRARRPTWRAGSATDGGRSGRARTGCDSASSSAGTLALPAAHSGTGSCHGRTVPCAATAADNRSANPSGMGTSRKTRRISASQD